MVMMMMMMMMMRTSDGHTICKAQIPLVASLHDAHVVCVYVLCVSCRVCSNMADDEEAVVLACTSTVFCEYLGICPMSMFF